MKVWSLPTAEPAASGCGRGRGARAPGQGAGRGLWRKDVRQASLATCVQRGPAALRTSASCARLLTHRLLLSPPQALPDKPRAGGWPSREASRGLGFQWKQLNPGVNIAVGTGLLRPCVFPLGTSLHSSHRWLCHCRQVRWLRCDAGSSARAGLANLRVGAPRGAGAALLEAAPASSRPPSLLLPARAPLGSGRASGEGSAGDPAACPGPRGLCAPHRWRGGFCDLPAGSPPAPAPPGAPPARVRPQRCARAARRRVSGPSLPGADRRREAPRSESPTGQPVARRCSSRRSWPRPSAGPAPGCGRSSGVSGRSAGDRGAEPAPRPPASGSRPAAWGERGQGPAVWACLAPTRRTLRHAVRSCPSRRASEGGEPTADLPWPRQQRAAPTQRGPALGRSVLSHRASGPGSPWGSPCGDCHAHGKRAPFTLLCSFCTLMDPLIH